MQNFKTDSITNISTFKELKRYFKESNTVNNHIIKFIEG